MLITGSFQIFVGKKKLTLEQKIHYESVRFRFRLINPNPNRVCPLLRTLQKRCASRLRFDEATGPYRSRELRRKNGR